MRVLHIDSERSFGGGQRQLVFLIRELHGKEGIIQALAAWPDSAIAKSIHDLNLPVELFPLVQRNDIDIRGAIKLKKYISGFSPDIVHTHTSRALSMTWLARKVFRLARPPIIINTRRVAFPLSGAISRSKYRGGADYHIAVSRACHDQITDSGVGAERVVTIPDGIEIPENIDREQSRKALLDLTGFKNDNIIVGACGNLLPVKRFDMLVEAVARVRHNAPEVRLLIIGEGRCRKVIADAIEKTGQQEVICMAGHVDRPERYYAGLDIFAMPSSSEGLGTSLIDAMARGAPLLGSNTSGIRDVIIENVNGIMFDTFSLDDLAAKLSMLAGNVELRKSLSKGPEIARAKFDIKEVSKRILNFYNTCITNNM